MFMIVMPIFIVILLGYCFGRIRPDSGQSDKLINDYVLYLALPALLFLAIARADMNELKQWGFIGSTLVGIVVIYVTAGFFAKCTGIGLPQSSLLSMGACYGTTGYMGVPILISVYGEQAALPAAIATILHNIPAIMAVIISWDLFSNRSAGNSVSLIHSLGKAVKATLTNPLTLSVLAGLLFVLLKINVPTVIASFARFLGNAAGPTALFALGLGLSRLSIKEHFNRVSFKIVLPMIALKLALQPAITFLVAYYLFDMSSGGIWLATAIVMSAQPIGAGVYVFAKKYEFKQEVISLAIVISLLMALVTIPLILQWFPI
ncbi:auxin efflux carrier (AEC) family transporter [Yersinia enterocolitica]|uniref:AEC family transporter n=1 Tax=Yersinia mollaretii TaxID=33060 RepID=UPI0005E0EB9C|nr:AEC family transporter [Yersinia mollaretii]CNK58842.1 auxin efflux carrier (AEC) family transporter [Yersinia enterocolitica]